MSNVEKGICEATVTRTGLFGSVSVEWKAGYPSGQTPPGFKAGVIIPDSGERDIYRYVCLSIRSTMNTSYLSLGGSMPQ